jgi:hypothetical protein
LASISSAFRGCSQALDQGKLLVIGKMHHDSFLQYLIIIRFFFIISVSRAEYNAPLTPLQPRRVPKVVFTSFRQQNSTISSAAAQPIGSAIFAGLLNVIIITITRRMGSDAVSAMMNFFPYYGINKAEGRNCGSCLRVADRYILCRPLMPPAR